MVRKINLRMLFACALLAAFHLEAATLVVLNKDDNSLSLINPSGGAMLATIPVGYQPHEVAVSSDGKYAFATNYGSGDKPGATLSMIDIAARREQVINLGPLRRPHGVCVSGGSVWFTAEGSMVVGRYSIAEKRIDMLLGTGQNVTHMVRMAPDGKTVITSDIGSDTITFMEPVNTRGGWNVTHVKVGPGPEALDISPDGLQIWTAHSGDGGISIIDIASRKVIATFPVDTKRANRLQFTPDGKHVLVSDLAGNAVLVIDTESRREIKRITPGKGPEGILIPEGSTVAYVAVSGENRIDLLDLKTFEVTGHISTGKSPDGMAWIP